MTYDAAPDPSARQGRKTVNESQDTPLSEGSWQPFLTVNACGRDWTLERAADMEALWESMTEFTEDERLPYWTELWPSSLVLADWLYQRRESLRGQPCLDLGCGIGLTALVGAVAGAGYILWKRSQPIEDPWAEEYWADLDTDSFVPDTEAEKATFEAGE